MRYVYSAVEYDVKIDFGGGGGGGGGGQVEKV